MEQENSTEFVVVLRGYGHPEKVSADHERTLRRVLEHQFGERFEMAPVTREPSA